LRNSKNKIMKNKSKSKIIKVKAMCLFECKGKVLACKAHDKVKIEKRASQ